MRAPKLFGDNLCYYGCMSESGSHKLALRWAEVERSINTLITVDGGFTAAQRGLVQLPNGEQVFIKVGVDEKTKKWAQKEVQAYDFLSRHKYYFAPRLLAANDDKTSFALEPLQAEAGWDWSDNWTSERLDKTLEAMDALADLTPDDAETEHIDAKTIFEYDDGWQSLVGSSEKQEVLLAKLQKVDRADLARSIDFTAMAERSAGYAFTNDVLVHNDVRGDNCAWNPNQHTVKLVDWNWAGLGDIGIDINALLVSVQKSGFDVTKEHANRLNASALQWLAGFWLHQATTPSWPGSPTNLRDFQLQSGIVALDLAGKT